MTIFVLSLICYTILEFFVTNGCVGRPNNFYEGRFLSALDVTSLKNAGCIFVFYEIEKNVWQISNPTYKYTIDMKGWFLDKIYLREFVKIKLLCQEHNRHKQKYYSAAFGNTYCSINEGLIKFVNIKGKEFCYQIIKRGKIKKGLSLRFRLSKYPREIIGRMPSTKKYIKNSIDITEFYTPCKGKKIKKKK